VNVLETPLEGVLLLELRVFRDTRGQFLESWSAERYAQHGIAEHFVQDNVSLSRKGVVRGLHFQNPSPQGKLVMVTYGAVFDVVVDLRRGASTFGQWYGADLSSDNHRQMWIPPGFAHGFQALSEEALLSYKCTEYYRAQTERTIRWDDPDIGIRWPLPQPVLSDKDLTAPLLRDLPEHCLFD
jgi:dTDP-4-dehydrorhamnose 3,5-epimerase